MCLVYLKSWHGEVLFLLMWWKRKTFPLSCGFKSFFSVTYTFLTELKTSTVRIHKTLVNLMWVWLDQIWLTVTKQLLSSDWLNHNWCTGAMMLPFCNTSEQRPLQTSEKRPEKTAEIQKSVMWNYSCSFYSSN